MAGERTMWLAELAAAKEREAAALEIAVKYSQIDGAHHKAWVIDQIVRILTGDGYAEFVAKSKEGEDGPETYDWNEGTAS